MNMIDQTFTRRAFLQGSLAAISAAATMPNFLHDSAFASEMDYGKAGNPDDRILVVVQLGGGNDGLNTVVPYRDDAYYKARRNLALREDSVIKLDKTDLALNSVMTGFADLYSEGALSIIQGVGYPNPNRSHFRSMDIWHTADHSGLGTGWIGRYMDATCNGSPEADKCIAIAGKAPRAALGAQIQPVAFEKASLFRWSGEPLHKDVLDAYNEINNQGPLHQPELDSNSNFLMRTAMDARVSSDKIRKAANARPMVNFPGTKLGQRLKLIASMIRGELPTRIYYTSQGGFDTHAGQIGNHQRLLTETSTALTAFYRELQKLKLENRVTIMVFSEFGRRVKPNASAGTDHGAAAPMFIIGDHMKAGIHGKQPSLTDLDKNGDLVHNVDFRSVYQSVLKDWLKADSAKVLHKAYPELEIFKARVMA